MSKFVISARKYRPSTFGEVQGQSHITATLQNALKNNQLAQVFLFCGPKGSGKTSCARILAKAINCEALTAFTEPCNGCKNCAYIEKQQSLNICELDAASNNSVEDVRNLIEQVRYRPPSGKKVFIIDEAHMLSNAAFHGLLKTLEEPPRHVVFIFATTEKYKVIETILSRCQIFDFHHLTTEQIQDQLKYVAKQEDINCEKEALVVISHQAGGSLRDALSMFDLVYNFEGGKKVSYEATLTHLNLLDDGYYLKIIQALVQGKVSEVLLLYNDIVGKSFRGDQFIAGFCEHIRNLLAQQVADGLPLFNNSFNLSKTYRNEVQDIDSSFLYDALDMAYNYGLNYKNAHNKRLHVEVMLITLARKQSSLHRHTSVQKQPVAYGTPLLKLQDNPLSLNREATSTGKKTVQLSMQKKGIPSKLHTTPKAIRLDNATSEKKVWPPGLLKEELLKHWEAYKKKLADSDVAGFSVMNMPLERIDHKIIVSLVHASQQDKWKRLKSSVEGYIAEKLGHKKFVIETKLQKQKIVSPKKYTHEEQFAYLMQKDPNVTFLQKAFDLHVL